MGTYTVSGTDVDNFGNTGTWTYTLTVNPRGVTQGSPKTGSVTQGNPFTDQLATTDGVSPVTFTVTSSSPAFTVLVAVRSPLPGTLAVGSYTVSGNGRRLTSGTRGPGPTPSR